ncbi:MAG: hypothetical protein ACI8QT_000403 [Halioglobus sp.]|jgi:hypothetical protein
MAEATKSDCEMRSFKFAVKWFWLPLRISLGIKKPKREILGAILRGKLNPPAKMCAGASIGTFAVQIAMGATVTSFLIGLLTPPTQTLKKRLGIVVIAIAPV